jgi:hypothetical protein
MKSVVDGSPIQQVGQNFNLYEVSHDFGSNLQKKYINTNKIEQQEGA